MAANTATLTLERGRWITPSKATPAWERKAVDGNTATSALEKRDMDSIRNRKTSFGEKGHGQRQVFCHTIRREARMEASSAT